MKESFNRAFEIVVGLEGNESNDPHDFGGHTKYGISQKSHPHVDIANLTLTEAKNIYRGEYWDNFRCDDLDYPVDIYMFDIAVNHRFDFAKSVFEGIKCISDNCEKRIYMIRRRIKEYNRIAEQYESQRKFHRGWINRVSRLIDSV